MARDNNNNRVGNNSRRSGGAGRVRDRSPDDRDNNRRGGDRGGDTNDSNKASSSTSAPPSSGPPDYHYHVRRAVRAGVDDNDFQKALLPEGTKIEVEELLEAMCNACDAVAQALPTSDPIDFEALATKVKDILTSHPKCLGNTSAANRFAFVFIQRSRTFLLKVEPPAVNNKRNQQQRSNKNDSIDGNTSKAGDGNEAPSKQLRTERQQKDKGNDRGNSNTNDGDSNAHNTTQKQQPPSGMGGILGDGPLPPPPRNDGGGALFFPPPPIGGGYNNNNYNYGGGGGVLAPPNIMNGGIQIPLPRNQQYLPNTVNAGNYNQQYNNTNHRQHNNNNTTNAAFTAVLKPAPDIGTRYVTLRGIPHHLASKEAIKGALETIINGLKQRIPNLFFLNYDVFTTEAVSEGGVASYYAVASFNTFSAASEVVECVNGMSVTDGSPVTAEGSSAEEIATFWGDQREKLEALEMEILHQFTQMDAAKAAAIAIESRLVDIAEETAAADADIKANTGDAEKKEALKDALKKRIALNREKEELFAQRKANNEANGVADPLSAELAVPERFSSSNAQPTNPRHLLYIADVAAPLSDDKVLLLLNRLEIQARHIWRDGVDKTNMICIELPVFGAVLGAMRRLDFLDGSFAGMRFTNEKPRKA